MPLFYFFQVFSINCKQLKPRILIKYDIYNLHILLLSNS